MKGPRERLLDMLEAVENIERYAGRGREAFERDELIQAWFIHHLMIIGEAASKIGEEFRLENPEIPWAEIVAMRNILVHEYFGIDLEEVWKAVEKDLPDLKNKLRSLLAKS